MRTALPSVISAMVSALIALPAASVSGRLASATEVGPPPAAPVTGSAWHVDLETAREAARSSGKPVLAVFDAGWVDGQPAGDVLASPEAAAVVAACFEPVRVDVDAHADLVRTLGVTHVPCACVLGPDDRLLTSFDCPGTPAEFVAAAARAAQVAAAGATATQQATVAAAGDPFAPAPTAARDGGPAATAVTDKVRRLASFADGDATGGSRFSTPTQPATVAPTAAAIATPASTAIAESTAVPDPAATPRLDSAPPAWPAERPTFSAFTAAPAAAPAAPPATTAPIEPAPQATPWLAAQPQPQPAADPQPAAGAAPVEPEAKPTNAFLAALQKPFSIFSPSASQPPKMPAARPQSPAALVAGAAADAAPQQPMPLGLEGYCPVTIAERGTWVEGRPQWGVRHRGRTYLFAGPEQQQAFLVDPDRYAPALSGDDPVLAFESGRCEPGRRAYGVTYQSRMYLFSSPDTRASFSADPGRYTSRVMIAEGRGSAEAVRRF